MRTPTVLQMEAVECGAAALGIVLAYYGRFVSLEELRIATGVSRDGAKASLLVRAARGYGLEAHGLRLELDEALTQPVPYIAFWGFNHFVVVEGADSRRVWINDPASGPRRISRKEFSDNFTGVALELVPGPDFRTGGSRRTLLSGLAARVGSSSPAIGYVMAASLLLVIPGLLLPAFLKTFVDDILVRGFDDWILPLLIGVLLAAALDGALTWLQQRHLLRLQNKLSITSAGRFFWHVLRVPVAFYTQRYVGDVADRVQSCHRLAQLLSGPLPTTAVNCLSVVFFVAVMAVYSVELTAAVVGLTALNVVAVRLVRRRRRDLNNVMLNQMAKLTGASMAGLQAIETLKSTGTENDFFATWSGHQTNTVNTNQRLAAVSNLLNAAPTLLDQLTIAVVLGGGGWLIIQGDLTIGGLVAFQLLLSHLTAPVQAFVGFGAQMQQIHGDLNRLDDVERNAIDPVLLAEDARVAETPPPGRLSGRVELRDVTFAYGPLDPPLIESFNLVLAPGRRVALVGSTGSGKSTIGKLLLGLYQPRSGQVLYDGIPLPEIPRAVFTASVASVDQDVFFFEGTIGENLTMWDDTIPREEVIAAAIDACIHDDIAARPGGYDGPMAERGANFSGGQAQRIEIARALVKRPAVLIMDEATSALDTLTEQTIDDNVRRRGCTCVIVAHRLSTIRDCDEIIVLDAGKAIERGTHEELMALRGRYAALVAGQ